MLLGHELVHSIANSFWCLWRTNFRTGMLGSFGGPFGDLFWRRRFGFGHDID